MAPWVRRSWARRGQTPRLDQRTRSHQKVSVIAALCIGPDRRRLHLYFRLYVDANINTARVIAFVRQLLRQWDGPLVIVWDRLRAHRSKKIDLFVGRSPRVHTFLLPPYAPELNPVEYVWSYLKTNPLANWAFNDVETLAQTARRHGRSLQHKHALLRSFVDHSPLPLRLR